MLMAGDLINLLFMHMFGGQQHGLAFMNLSLKNTPGTRDSAQSAAGRFFTSPRSGPPVSR